MAAAVAEERGRVVVVTGGFHTVALPGTTPAMPRPVKVDPKDALVALMRYGFEQLDRLNGYASGMPSPEFYQRTWEGKPVAGSDRRAGPRGQEPADRRLGGRRDRGAGAGAPARARLRGHHRPSREDLARRDPLGLTSRGPTTWRACRSWPWRGSSWPATGWARSRPRPAFRRWSRTSAGRPRGSRSSSTGSRRRRSRSTSTAWTGPAQLSRFFHRLRFLSVPFAQWVAGPDYVTGQGLERVKEVWKYRWSPGDRIDPDRAVALRLDARGGGGRPGCSSGSPRPRRRARAGGPTGRRACVLEACRMGLHRHTRDLLDRTVPAGGRGRLVRLAGPGDRAAHRAPRLARAAGGPRPGRRARAWPAPPMRGPATCCPAWPARPRPRRTRSSTRLTALQQTALSLGDDRRPPRACGTAGSASWSAPPACPAAIRGAAPGLLFGDGAIEPGGACRPARGHLLSAKDGGHEGAAFLRGLLHTARSVLWLVPDVLDEPPRGPPRLGRGPVRAACCPSSAWRSPT